MCKIIVLQQHNPAKRDTLIASAWKYFEASGEDDGFGALWLSKGKTLAWRKASHPKAKGKLPAWADAFCGSGGAHREPSDGGWLMLHGRTATCGVTLDNTHPMVDESGTAGLIHNGVVSSEVVANVTTTCDSELLLRAWMQGADKGLSHIAGYFAFAGLFWTEKGWQAVVARDATARLRCGESEEGGWAWSTTDEGLSAVGAQPLRVDHRPMHGLVWTDGKPKPYAFGFTKAPTPVRSQRDLALGWQKASAGYDWPVTAGETVTR